MSLIGNFPPSVTSVFNLDFLPEKVLVAVTEGNNQCLSNLSVVCKGVQLMSVTSVPRITALAKFDSGAILPDNPGNPTTASYLKLAAGRINDASTITGTNATGGSQPFFAASTCISNIARRAVEQSINPSANATFNDFEALFFLPTDILRAQITFSNGFTDEYSVAELNALYANFHVSDEGGKLEGLTCIDADSGAGLISQVVLYNGAGAATVVLRTDYVQI